MTNLVQLRARGRSRLMALRGFIPKLVARLLFSALVIIASLRDYLFGNGLFLYRDWSWPLSTSVTPVNVFSPGIVTNSGPDPLGFARMFLNWPIVFIDAVTPNPVLAEKIFIIYLYAVLLFLSFVFGELILRLLDRFSNRRLSGLRREIFILFIVIFSLANLWSLQQLSDFYYTYIYGLMIVSISIALTILRNADRRSLIISGVLVSTIGFLAPEVYPFAWIALAVVAVLVTRWRSGIPQTLKTAATRILILTVVNLPLLTTMLYLYSVTLGTNVRPINSYGDSLSTISPDNALRLLGYWWSLITYAPPTVAGGGPVSQLPSVGTPPYLVQTGDAWSLFWLATTWTVPVLAFSALIIRRFRAITIPAAAVAAIGFLFTQPVIFPIPHMIAVALQGQRTLGGAVASLISIPDHALIMLTSAYLVLVAVVFYHLMTTSIRSLGRWKNRVPNGRSILPNRSCIQRIVKAVVITAFLVFLLMPGWQFFSGSFYPAGYTSGIRGNGVPDIGAFTSAQPPQEMTQVYNWLQSQQGLYNIYWPGPDGSASYPWSLKSTPSVGYAQSPQPTIQNWVLDQSPFPSALKYLVESNLTADIAPYLQALNMRYLVLQPLSESAMLSVWGISDPSQLTRLIESTPGISLVYSSGAISVFEISNDWGDIYPADTVLSYPQGDNHYGVAYGVLESTGLHPAFTTSNEPNQLCIDTLSCPIAIESPGFLATTLLNGSTHTTLDNSGVQSSSIGIPSSAVASLPNPWSDWTLANWGPAGATASIENGIMHCYFGPDRTLLSLSYNGTVTSNNPGGITIPEGLQTSVIVSFSYRTSSTLNSKIQAVLPLLNNTQQFFDLPSSNQFPPSESWTEANYSTTLPATARDFTARIQTDASSGWIELKDVRIKVVLLTNDQKSFFGSLVPLMNNNANELTLQPGYTYMQYTGTGTVACNGVETAIESIHQFSWIRIEPCSSGKIHLAGFSIGAVIATKQPLSEGGVRATAHQAGDSVSLDSIGSVVATHMFAPGYTLTSRGNSYRPVRTLDGVMLFEAILPGSYALTFSSLNVAVVAYVATLIFTILMILDPARITRTVKRIRGQEQTSFKKESEAIRHEVITA